MIGIDLTFFYSSTLATGELNLGTEFFCAELLDGFVKLGLQSNFCLIADYDCVEFIRKRFPEYPCCVVGWFPGQLAYKLSKGKKNLSRYRKKIHPKLFLRAVERSKISCVWYPYTTPTTTIWGGDSVCTIHDIIPFYTNPTPEVRQAWRNMVNRCGKIVTISDFVRADISEVFGVEKDEISVIPNSIEVDLREISEEPVHNKKYILDMNAYVPHKNTITLLKAFARIADQTDLDLVFCGARKDADYWKQLKDYISEHGLENRVFMYYQVPINQKNWLFKNASLFVTPSMNEGFGRSPVEAAICGVPVISTKETSLYEATKGLVHYYEEPENDALLAETLLRCIENPDSPEQLEKIAREFSDVYSIESCAASYWKILKQYKSSI